VVGEIREDGVVMASGSVTTDSTSSTVLAVALTRVEAGCAGAHATVAGNT